MGDPFTFTDEEAKILLFKIMLMETRGREYESENDKWIEDHKTEVSEIMDGHDILDVRACFGMLSNEKIIRNNQLNVAKCYMLVKRDI